MKRSLYQALGNLYGIIPVEKVRELFRTGVDDCPDAMRYRNLVVNPQIPHDEIAVLEKQQEQHPWYRPGLERLALYADPLYYDETPESKGFQQYLRGRFSLTRSRSRYCLGVFSGYIRRAKGVDDLEEIFDSLEFPTISQIEMQTMLSFYIPFYNHSRMWANRGFSPKEIREMRFLP
ncbi:MAG: hypothetical protein SPF89_04575 [Sphaerochaetaceae bacterium]|nr:hypothetical protein [Spirochaetales bacterium]MDY5499360.1 hypothetical protein [Sphaerochaetaceae bacterium]